MKSRLVAAHLRALGGRDPLLAEAVARLGNPPSRQRTPGFETLLRIILAQQVSTASARSLWTRLEQAIVPLSPAEVGRRDEAALRALGLSRQKAAYALHLAGEIVAGRIELDRLSALGDEDAIAMLTQAKGIGRWTAEIYLLFALGRPDVWPAGDLALAVAMQALRRLPARPDPRQMIALAEPWRPYRGAAAHLLWHSYARMRARDGAPP